MVAGGFREGVRLACGGAGRSKGDAHETTDRNAGTGRAAAGRFRADGLGRGQGQDGRLGDDGRVHLPGAGREREHRGHAQDHGGRRGRAAGAGGLGGARGRQPPLHAGPGRGAGARAAGRGRRPGGPGGGAGDEAGGGRGGRLRGARGPDGPRPDLSGPGLHLHRDRRPGGAAFAGHDVRAVERLVLRPGAGRHRALPHGPPPRGRGDDAHQALGRRHRG